MIDNTKTFFSKYKYRTHKHRCGVGRTQQAWQIEIRGRGIQRIFEACQKAGTTTPIIDYKPNDLWIEFPFSPEYLKAIATTSKGETLTGGDQKTSGKTSGKIVALMTANALITIPELAIAIGVTERSIERTIKNLQQGGYIRRIGPAKGGHWEVVS